MTERDETIAWKVRKRQAFRHVIGTATPKPVIEDVRRSRGNWPIINMTAARQGEPQ